MSKYQTKIRVMVRAKDESEAEEIVGKLFSIEKMIPDMIISCGPTHDFSRKEDGFLKDKFYETIVCVMNEGRDELEAGEIAGELFNVEKMDVDTVVSCEATKPVNSGDGCRFKREDCFA